MSASRRPSLWDLSEFSTRPQVAAVVGVSVPTLARWATQNSGPPVTYFGRTVRYRKRDVIAWADEQSDKTKKDLEPDNRSVHSAEFEGQTETQSPEKEPISE